MRVFFKIPFLYLREREVAREGVSREEREEEKGGGEEGREHHPRLHTRTLGLWPELKAAA